MSRRSAKTIKHGQGPQSMGYRVKVLSQLFTRILQEQLEPYNLTVFHFIVLTCLWKEDGLAISELGEQLQQVGGTMTGVIDRMEERGLIGRERDDTDRRIWRAWLTEKGRKLGVQLPPFMAKARETVLKGISADDYECFLRVLDRLITNSSRLE